MLRGQNQIKRALLEDATTDRKVVVDWEINGWLHTNQKKKEEQPLFEPKRKKIISVLQSLDDIGKAVEATKRRREEQFTNASMVQLGEAKEFSCQKPRLQIRRVVGRPMVSQEVNQIQMKRLNLNSINQDKANIRAKRSIKGYVLNEQRRQMKQKSQMRQYSLNGSLAEKQNTPHDPNVDPSVHLLQKKFRVVSMTSRVEAGRTVVRPNSEKGKIRRRQASPH